MYDADSCHIGLRNRAALPEPALAWLMPESALSFRPLMLGADQQKQILPETIPRHSILSAARHKGSMHLCCALSDELRRTRSEV